VAKQLRSGAVPSQLWRDRQDRTAPHQLTLLQVLNKRPVHLD